MTTLVLLLAVVLAPPSAPAAPAEENAGVTYDPTIDAAVAAGAAAAFLGSEWLVKREFALSANWTRVDGLDSSAAKALRWGHPGTAHTLSNLTVGAAFATTLGLTALAAAHEGRRSEFWIDALLIGEAVAIDGTLNQLVKFTVRRARPCAGDCPSHDGKDDNLSFYSEHSSLIFALASSAGTVARRRAYRWAPAIWIATATLGAATAYLRIAANEHYLTDVIAGAAVGTAVGVAVPYLSARPRFAGQTCATFAALPAPHGAALTLTLALRW